MSEQQSLSDFIRAHGITMSAARANDNPHASDFGPGARHWSCTLTRAAVGETLRVPFSQGSAHTKVPTAEDVLDCLASDSAGVENASSFEDWAADYGYDADSRKAERTYNVCKAQAERLRVFLGDGAYQQLLFNVERQ